MRFLTRPSARYRDTYLDALGEFHREGRYFLFEIEATAADFGRYVDGLLAEETPPAFSARVPVTYCWLMDGTSESDPDAQYIGYVSIRHRLDDYLLRLGGHIGYAIRPSRRRRGYGTDILRLALPKARELGLSRVLITCDADNVGSKKIIERNGGVFENAVPYEELGRKIMKLRYWIDL